MIDASLRMTILENAAAPDHLKDAVAKITAKPTASASPQKQTERKKANVVKIQ